MRKLILSLLLFTTPLTAAIFHEIDTTKPLCCGFSSQHHNRILVDQGRVKKIIFPEEKLFVRMEEVSGQVFVQAKSLLIESTLISVVTQDGQIQDLEITFSDRSSQVIVLKDPCLEPEIIYQLAEVPSCDPYNSLNCQIETLLKGEVPCGYQSVPFKRCLWKPKFGISVKLVARLQGYSDELLLYEVSNTTWWKKKISEKEIARCGVNWAYLEKSCLKSKETVLGIISVRNE